MSPSSPHLPRYAGLDGLRAIAVGLVLIYHLFPGLGLLSGLVGVDVFFVVSGFLITSLMLRPTRHPLRHRLLDFWRRRARRLLPALAVMLTVCATVAWLIGGDVLVGIGRQLLGASTFSYNWVALAGGSDYFAATEPELFRNVWSLAVEEQFYLLWPLLLPLLLAVLRVRWALVAFAVVAAGASAWWMSVLVSTGSVTRAYFGTDSHAFGLLLGIALAFGIRRMPEQEWMLRPSVRASGVLLGMLGIGLVVFAAFQHSQPAGAGFPGTLLLASAGTVLAVFAGVMPGSWFGRAIDVQPLRWIGDRSYGIYLWHWPVLVLVSAASGLGVSAQVAGVPVWAGCTALVLSVTAAAVSFRVVETPLRRLGFRRSLRAVRVRFARGPVSRLAMATSALAAVLALGGTTAAVASAPPMTTSEMAIRAGQEALKKVVPTPAPTTPAAISGTDVTAVGDSVMLASAPALQQQFPGIEVDAKVSRSVWAGPRIIDALEDSGNLREHVVVALGTNGSVDEDVLQSIADTVGRNRDLVLVNAYAPRDWIPGVNRDLQSFAAGRLGVVVADWAGAIAPHEDLLAGDRIHPGDAGGRIFAEVVEEGIRDAEAERAARPRITPEPVQ
ncbi:acyltransferase family protein [Microbacterium arabinogalactanolyticum]|uniref:acyltransferase family protein n=1 Tax=Microbacterium arabinogalactanolyticum TaxID=69365 RepID=UPI004043FEB0